MPSRLNKKKIEDRPCYTPKLGQNMPILACFDIVFQGVLEVYNQTFCDVGDNDFAVEHAGARKRQREGGRTPGWHRVPATTRTT